MWARSYAAGHLALGALKYADGYLALRRLDH
jgi:hypothetical protein